MEKNIKKTKEKKTKKKDLKKSKEDQMCKVTIEGNLEFVISFMRERFKEAIREEANLIKEIAQKIISGEITSSEDYYNYCADLDFTKNRLNKRINKVLASFGDGKTAIKIIRENKKESMKEIPRNMRYKL